MKPYEKELQQFHYTECGVVIYGINNEQKGLIQQPSDQDGQILKNHLRQRRFIMNKTSQYHHNVNI